MRKFLKAGLVMVAAVALLHVPSAARAQATASITASATVAGALTATGVRGLSFGTVIANFPRTVATTDATSGHFRLDGGVNAEVDVTFSSLPATLSDGGANTLGITYSATHNTTDAGGSGTIFTPSSGLTTRLDAASGQLHIYIGGTVSPVVGQAPGLYQGTITLDASYTGN